MSFEDRVCDHIPHLRRYARALCGSASLADDLVQDSLLRALRKRHLWRPSGNLRSWLLRIVYRTYLNRLDSAAVRREWPVADAAERAVHAARQEDHVVCRDVLEAVQRLPEDQRSALLLMALEAPSYRDAARILDIQVGTLRSRLSRARGAVRRCMDEPGRESRGARLRRVK